MQKASNAIKGTKTRSKTGKEATSSSSGKEAARPASSASHVKVAVRPASLSGKVVMRPPASAVPVKEAAKSVSSKQASSETVIAEPVEEEHQQPETPAKSLPPAVQAEKAALEPTVVENKQHETTSQQVAGTNITAAEETEQTEQDRAEQPTAGSEIEEIVEEENHVMDDAGVMNVETPELEPQEQKKLQSSTVAQAETEAQESTSDESPTVVVEEAAKEVATLEAAEDEPTTSMVEKTVVQGSRAEEKPQEQGMEPEDLRENSVFIDDYENRLLPNNVMMIRNYGGDKEGLKERRGGAKDQQRRPSQVGVPIQVELKSNSDPKNNPHQNRRPDHIPTPFWPFFIWMER
jgi:hypothetical protein